MDRMPSLRPIEASALENLRRAATTVSVIATDALEAARELVAPTATAADDSASSNPS